MLQYLSRIFWPFFARTAPPSSGGGQSALVHYLRKAALYRRNLYSALHGFACLLRDAMWSHVSGFCEELTGINWWRSWIMEVRHSCCTILGDRKSAHRQQLMRNWPLIEDHFEGAWLVCTEWPRKKIAQSSMHHHFATASRGSLQRGPVDPKFQIEGVAPTPTILLLRKLG